MANSLVGKVWSLDTAVGLVTSDPVNIHAIHIRFTTAGVGSCVITTAPKEGTAATTLLDLKTTAASTAAVYILDERYTFGDQFFDGLKKTVSVNVDTIYIITGVSK